MKVDAQNEDLGDMSIPSHIGGYASVVFGYHGGRCCQKWSSECMKEVQLGNE